jgi:glycosyltransferase involved in cell wall biosynthesis
MGARLHYAVPATYARANALHRLYTDACASVGLLSIARERIPAAYRSAAVRRLLARTLPPEVPREFVRVETLSTLVDGLRKMRTGEVPANVSAHERLRRKILRRRFDGANCFYTLDNRDLELVRAARDAGLAVIFEQVSSPNIGRVVREERHLFRGIEKESPDAILEEGIARDTQAFRLANIVTCPSDYVQQEVRSLAGETVRTALTPYGINEDWLETRSSPIPGRILFVGRVCLLKGSHYLAEAARILKARGVPCEIRVVGPYSPDVIARPAFQGPTYVGPVPRDAVRSEFAEADVFAFPSLTEGLAMVQLEAMACGVPVVTTPRAGGQVRDGQDGFVVPIRDPRALADRLEQIVSDRELREKMSHSARRKAQELSWSHFGQLLLAATHSAMLDAAGVEQRMSSTG